MAAAELLAWPEESLTLRGADVIRQDTGDEPPLGRSCCSAGVEPVVGRGSVHDMHPSPVTSFTAQVAEVAVDPETGAVQLLRFTTAHDVGKVLNPVDHQGQIEGAVMQGIGYALSEELVVDEGRVTSVSFGDYKIPNMQDIPALHTIILESESGPGPYNARGIGENPIGPVAPAIANAVADAVGVRIKDLPITAEKVYRALIDHIALAKRNQQARVHCAHRHAERRCVMQQLTSNVFVETQIRGCNHGFVTTSDGIVMIDSPHKPSDALKLKAEIARRGQLRYIINTEPHGDHWTGNAFFDVPVIAHEGVRTRILEHGYRSACGPRGRLWA